MTLRRMFVVGAVLSLALSACGDVVVPPGTNTGQDTETTDPPAEPDTNGTGTTTSDVPDTGTPEPDTGTPEPDTGTPEPDAGPADPDVSEPDAGEGDAETKPDVPEPDTGEGDTATTPDVPEPECTDAEDDNSCDDSDACTIDSCVEGVCTYELRDDACIVDGECIEDGATSADNACLVCDVSVATDALQFVLCEDDNPCTVNACDESTGCDFSEPDNEASCDDGQACSSDDHCEAGECVGECVCEIDSDCDGKVEVGACERAVCVDYDCVVTSDPGQNGDACGGGLCTTAGQCDFGLCIGEEDKDCSSADAGACKPGVCNAETGACETSVDIDGTACTDANACTDNDQCVSGVCLGTAKDCSSFDGACTSGVCEEGSCVGEILVGQSCDPGNECVLDASCNDAGACLGGWDSANCPCQENSNCNDGLNCTTDYCDVDTGSCVFALLPNSCSIGGACYAGQVSNPDNACQVCDPAQATTSWSEVVCNDGNDCTKDSCTDGTCGAENDDSLSCDDGDACTEDDHCEAGQCVGYCECKVDADCAEVTVDVAPNQCQTKVCVDFQCVVVSDAAKEGNACDDGLACTEGELCSAGSCTGGTEVVCEDSDSQCATNACLEEASGCTVVNSDAGVGCDDADPCTDNDVCSGTGQCAGLQKDCSGFADQCNAAQCDSGDCVKVPSAFDGADCSDGEDCTIGDSCSSGSCSGTWDGENAACGCNGDDGFCDDGLACTINTCSADGSCVTTIKNGFCKIGNACFGDGALNPENQCQICEATVANAGWQQRDCDDNKPCTDNVCQPTNGCVFPSNNSLSCNDGDPCSSDDSCVGGECVGTCECTTDAQCTDQAPQCQRYACINFSCVVVDDGDADGTQCDDGQYCTVGDSCSGGVCQAGSDRDCSDSGDGQCKVGICNEPTNECVAQWRPEGTICNDGDPCTIGDVCGTPGQACAGTEKDCDEFSDQCNLGICTAAGNCQASPTIGASCTDGEGCTVSDECTAAGSCVGTWDQTLSDCGCNDDSGCASFDDDCNIGRCNVDTHECYAEPKVGESCDDGNLCTSGDQCSSDGTCGGSSYSCNDNKACTDDVCDGNGGCSNTVQADRCLIDGACYNQDQTQDGNVCLICAGGQESWTDNDGVSCDDGAACTHTDICQAGNCTATAYTCDDGLSCTDDTCDGNGGCDNDLEGGFCIIGDSCVGAGNINPENGCQTCLPSVNTGAWSSNTNACDDGNPCTKGDICGGGECSGTSYSCSDGLACTQDASASAPNAEVCDGDGGCTYPILSGCLIGGACYGDAQERPGNPCEYCKPPASTTSWTAKGTGVVCDDGLPCTPTSFCNEETRSCEGSSECNPLSCENASCTEDGCDIELKANFCKIDGACYEAGASEPDGNSVNPCRVCNPESNTMGWTVVGGSCDDGDDCTKNDACNGAGECAGEAYICDDNKACTTDICLGDGSCKNSIKPNNCVIDEICYEVGDNNPSNECQECSSNNKEAWVNRTGSCTPDDLTCTLDQCNAGSCEHPRDPNSNQCLISGTCYANNAPKPSNECKFCNATGSSPTSWTNYSSGTPCTDDGNSCTADACNGSGSCVATTLEDFTTCSDDNGNTYADWCFSGSCGGFTRTSQTDQTGDTEYIKASTSSKNGAHALFRSNQCTGFVGCNVDLDRYAGSGTLQETWTVGGTFLQASWAIAENIGVSGSVLREFNSGSNVWSYGDEEPTLSALATIWNGLNNQTSGEVETLKLIQFSAIERLDANTVYGFGAGPVTVSDASGDTTSLESVVRYCSYESVTFPFVGTVTLWLCTDQPARPLTWSSTSSSTQVSYKDCAGFGSVDGTLFLGCNYYGGLTAENFFDFTDENVTYRDILAYNADAGESGEWRYRSDSSGPGKPMKGFTAAGNYLIGVGLQGTLLVTSVTDGVPGQGNNVAITGFGNQEITDFHAVTVHGGRVWVVGSYVDNDMFGGSQKLILVHADADADLSDGSNWSVKTIHSISGLCLIDIINPQPCGELGTDFTFKAVAGDSDGIYIFGSWFDASAGDEGQRNRTVWHWSVP